MSKTKKKKINSQLTYITIILLRHELPHNNAQYLSCMQDVVINEMIKFACLKKLSCRFNVLKTFQKSTNLATTRASFISSFDGIRTWSSKSQLYGTRIGGTKTRFRIVTYDDPYFHRIFCLSYSYSILITGLIY